MRVEVNGCSLYFDVEGVALVPDGDQMRERPTVILLHGGPGADHTIHKPAFSKLSDLAQVIYLDHRGNGRSGPSGPEYWTLTQWADDLHVFCQTLGISQPIVLGTSFGGFVAQAYAVRYPAHPLGLILVSTAARIDFQTILQAFDRRGGAEARDVAAAYWMSPTSESRARYREVCVPLYKVDPRPADWLRRTLIKDDVALHFNGPKREMGRMDHRHGLARVTCPVLLLAGEQDPMTPPEFSEEIAASLTGAPLEFHRIPDAGHGIVGDSPDVFFDHVRAFIRRLDAQKD